MASSYNLNLFNTNFQCTVGGKNEARGTGATVYATCNTLSVKSTVCFTAVYLFLFAIEYINDVLKINCEGSIYSFADATSIIVDDIYV